SSRSPAAVLTPIPDIDPIARRRLRFGNRTEPEPSGWLARRSANRSPASQAIRWPSFGTVRPGQAGRVVFRFDPFGGKPPQFLASRPGPSVLAAINVDKT